MQCYSFRTGQQALRIANITSPDYIDFPPKIAYNKNALNKGDLMNIIFDMDGLMFDTERVFIKAWDYAGEKIGIGKAGFMAAGRGDHESHRCQI